MFDNLVKNNKTSSIPALWFTPHTYNTSSYVCVCVSMRARVCIHVNIVLRMCSQTKPVIDSFHVALHILSIESQQLIHSIA